MRLCCAIAAKFAENFSDFLVNFWIIFKHTFSKILFNNGLSHFD